MTRRPEFSPTSRWFFTAFLAVLLLLSCAIFNPSVSTTHPTVPSASGSPQPAGSNFTPAFDFTAGLAKLTSYHVEFMEIEKGQLDGKPYAEHNRISRSLVAQPPGEDSTLENLKADGSTYFLHYLLSGGAQYFQHASGGACQGQIDAQPNGHFPNPADLLLRVSGAQKAGVETLSGLPVTHYRFTDSDLPLSGQTAAGEVWISNQDGLVLKYLLAIQPPAPLTGTGLEVARSIQYELSSINQLAPLSLPAACIPVLTAIPALPDAVDLERTSAAMSFTTPSSKDQVVAFYNQALPPLGWTPLANQDPSADYLIFQQAKQELTLDFIPLDSGLDVEIMLDDPAYHFPTAQPEPTQTPPAGPTPTQAPTPTFDMALSGLPADVPLYPGASRVQAANGMGISFQTGDSLEQVAKFYTDNLKSAGWQLINNNNIGKVDIQTWLKGKTILNVNIQDQQAQRLVTLMAAAKP